MKARRCVARIFVVDLRDASIDFVSDLDRAEHEARKIADGSQNWRGRSSNIVCMFKRISSRIVILVAQYDDVVGEYEQAKSSISQLMDPVKSAATGVSQLMMKNPAKSIGICASICAAVASAASGSLGGGGESMKSDINVLAAYSRTLAALRLEQERLKQLK